MIYPVPLSIAIRGAGAAGLSLARALLERMPEASVSIFDRRPRFPHPKRTFCFFADPGAICPVPPTYRWNRVILAGTDFKRILDCHDTPYTLTHGDGFFTTLLADLESRGVQFYWACDDVEIDRNQILTGGRAHAFDLVVDAAFNAEGREAVLWQSFTGIWVRSPQPIFNPEAALLMELQDCEPGTPLRFAYLLPTSPYTALIEHTAFSPRPFPRGWHLERCRAWLAARGWGGIEEEDSEYGAIPLGLKSRSAGLSVGSAGGAIRASTGYAFQTIQHQVANLAQQIADSPPHLRLTQPTAFPAWMKLGDHLFLQALASAPSRGTAMMEQLLTQAPERELIRFLAGQASLWEALRVMVKVPKVAMIRALCFGGG